VEIINWSGVNTSQLELFQTTTVRVLCNKWAQSTSWLNVIAWYFGGCFAVLRQLRVFTVRYIGLSSSHWCCVWCYHNGLLQCSVGRHSTAPCMVVAIDDKRGRTARLCVIKVWLHHPAPMPITLPESPWRTDYKLAVVVNKCLYGLAPSYLADKLHHPAVWVSRHLRSGSSHELSVPHTRLSNYGNRAFPVAAVWIWNSLPQHITSSPWLLIFCSHLKDILLRTLLPVITVVVSTKWHCHLWTR